MTSITQEYLDNCADDLEFDFVTIVDIEAKDPIRLADKNIYVAGRFYENRIKTPKIVRSIGEFLAPSVKFSRLKLDINNVDGAYNPYLVGGDKFPQLAKALVTVSLGINGEAESFNPIFKGYIEPIGGVKRDAQKITLSVKDTFEALNIEIPEKTFSKTDYPFMDENELGKRLPLVLGAWNGQPELTAAICNALEILNENGDIDEDKPVKCLVSLNPLSSLDAVYLKRGEDVFPIDPEDIKTSESKNTFELKQNGKTIINIEDEEKSYIYSKSDKFLVKATEETTNIIDQAKHLIETFSHEKQTYDESSWNEAREKLSYVKSRVALDKPKKLINYVLSLLEQTRCELFVSRNLNLKLSCLHLDSLNSKPDQTMTNWDIEKDSLKIASDEKTSFNVAQAFYAYAPVAGGNTLTSPLYENKLSVEQLGEVGKAVEMPNLFEGAEQELIEILKISSSFREEISFNASLRSLLLDVGDMVYLRVKIGSIEYKDIICQVREIGLDKAYRIPIKLLSFQMCPFKGYEPNYPGTAGGIAAKIEVKNG